MSNGYRLLTEREIIWARSLEEVLADNAIPYTDEPVYGAAMVLKAGARERLRIYVPDSYYDLARNLEDELFRADDE